MSSNGLKVIALISGGKDSLYSILHCIAQGHKVVAIANLYPKDVENDESGEIENEVDVDSFMYQTVGHSVIGHYASVLGLPLFRRPILGLAIDQTLNYSPFGTNDFLDEAEDLFLLLKDVLMVHPEATAVSCGAILSTYQRMRVESVAIRLNLIPLAYLWQFPALPPYGDEILLDDMRLVGQKAIIIKVASGGLDSSFLGMNVSDTVTIHKLKMRMDRFGRRVGALIGEGGEFETLAIEGPKPLWRKKIFTERQVIVQGEGGSAALHLIGIKTAENENENGLEANPRVPNIFDEEFGRVLGSDQTFKGQSIQLIDFDIWQKLQNSGVQCQIIKNGHVLRYSNMTGTGETAQIQMESMTKWLLNDMKRFDNPSMTTTLLILRDMKDFQGVNNTYGRMFDFSLPPSRVTISCGDLLPNGKDVVMSITLDCRKNQSRQGIHVQSRSYWAPANIGPYSQAIVEPLERLQAAQDFEQAPCLVHMAGQIPLIPALMELPDLEANEFRYQAILSCQHLWRVGRVMNISQWTGGLAYLNSDLDTAESKANEAMTLWRDVLKSIHDEWNEWDKENGQVEQIKTSQSQKWNSELGYLKCLEKDLVEYVPIFDAHDRPWLPNFSNLLLEKNDSFLQPCFVVLVSDLPRSSPIEWWSLGFSLTAIRQTKVKFGDISVFRVTSITSGVIVSWIAVPKMAQISELEQLEEFKWSIERKTLPICTIYLSTDLDSDKIINWNPTIVPCKAVWSESGRIDALVVLIYYAPNELS